ncbi:MAG: dihydroorotase [Thermoplasmata archaeon]|nr:MAG: dihydroorotase [Thermoplasmata archaeon]
MEVVIEGNAFVRGGLQKCAIGIEDGKIKDIKKILKGDKHHDFGDKLVLPAAVDAHVHFREPGMTHKEDFESGTACAAHGGISCVLDMPNTQPPTTTVDALNEKIRLASEKAHVDFGIYAGITKDSDIEGLSKLATAFKIYLATTTGELLFDDWEALGNVFNRIDKTEKKVAVHCEDNNLIDKTAQPETLEDHHKSRPNQCEAQAIEKVLALWPKPQLHICHVSTMEGVDLVRKADVSSEVSPHHLLLNHRANLEARGKVNPPLRDMKDQEALWDAFSKGEIDIVASDHAPHTPEEKEKFTEAPSGVPGVETMLPLLLVHVKLDRLDLSKLVRAVSERPAKMFGLNKGVLEVGRDADIIMVDMRKEKEIKTKKLHYKCGWTPYERFTAVFPRFTFVRGEMIVEDWELTGEKGFGRMAKD